MPLGPILIEYTTFPIFLSMLLILALLKKKALFKNYFESNTIVLLAKEIVIHLTISE